MEVPPLKTPKTCSQCGHNGHNTRTCTDHGGSSGSATGFMFFGVRLTAAEGSPSRLSSAFRKSVSMNNLSQYELKQPQDSSCHAAADSAADGYVSDDAVHASSGIRSRERKRGVAWTEEEHKLFFMGLKKVGKGDWRAISRNFVKTRTPTQVDSHAQKYFLRRTNFNRRRHRSSLFDITTDTMTNSSIEDQSFNQDSVSQSRPPTSTVLPPTSTRQTPPIPLIPVPPSSKMAKLNLNQSPLSSSSSVPSDGSRDREFNGFWRIQRQWG